MEDYKEIAREQALLLARCAIWFRGYAAVHRAKHNPEGDIKAATNEAATNEARAAEIEALVDRYGNALS